MGRRSARAGSGEPVETRALLMPQNLVGCESDLFVHRTARR